MRSTVPKSKTQSSSKLMPIAAMLVLYAFLNTNNANNANAYYAVPDALVGGPAAASSNYLLYGPNYYRYFYKELHEKQLEADEKERKKAEKDDQSTDGAGAKGDADDLGAEDADGNKQKEPIKEIKLPTETEEPTIIKANATNMPEAVFSSKKQTLESVQNGFSNPEYLLVAEPVVVTNANAPNVPASAASATGITGITGAKNGRALFCEEDEYNNVEPPIVIASSDADLPKRELLLGQNSRPNTQNKIVIDGKKIDNSDAFTITVKPANKTTAGGKQQSVPSVDKENLVSNGRNATKTLYIQNNSGKDVPKYLIPDGFDVKNE